MFNLSHNKKSKKEKKKEEKRTPMYKLSSSEPQKSVSLVHIQLGRSWRNGYPHTLITVVQNGTTPKRKIWQCLP